MELIWQSHRQDLCLGWHPWAILWYWTEILLPFGKPLSQGNAPNNGPIGLIGHKNRGSFGATWLPMGSCVRTYAPPPPPCPRTGNVRPRNEGAVLAYAFPPNFDRWLRLRLRLGFRDVKMLGDCIIIHDDDDDVHDEKPNTLVKKVVRELDRRTRGRFLRKAVPRHGGGGGVRVLCSSLLLAHGMRGFTVVCMGVQKCPKGASCVPWYFLLLSSLTHACRAVLCSGCFDPVPVCRMHCACAFVWAGVNYVL